MCDRPGVHRVLVLGPSDGRETLTGVARELSEQVHQHHLAATDVDINLLNNRLTGIYTVTLFLLYVYTS
jgi:chemotaxis methyl-accepting protein methylase